jgi:uncharacterized protein
MEGRLLKRNPSNLLIRYPLASFFILAYGIAWISLALQYIYGSNVLPVGGFSPAIAALIMAAVGGGASGFRDLVSRLFVWRTGIKWYLVALLAPFALELMAIPFQHLLGSPASPFDAAGWLRTLPALFLVLLFLLFMAVGEELGWRGFALPGLQARYGPIRATLILGLLWGLWHLPLFYIPGTIQYGLPAPGYVIATMGYAFIYTCIFNGTKGSVLLTSLYHAASNLLLTYGNVISPSVIKNLYLSLPPLGILIVLVILINGPGLLRRSSV